METEEIQDIIIEEITYEFPKLTIETVCDIADVIGQGWDWEEELLYKEVIADVQKKVMKEFENLCTYTFTGIEDSCYKSNSYKRHRNIHQAGIHRHR